MFPNTHTPFTYYHAMFARLENDNVLWRANANANAIRNVCANGKWFRHSRMHTTTTTTATRWEGEVYECESLAKCMCCC